MGATQSAALGAGGGQQVGYATFNGNHHAGLWRGSSASWVDLNPLGSSQSEAHGAASGVQVGWAYSGGFQHAGIWQGSADSWTDLHSLLPAGFQASQARGVFRFGPHVRVVGWAQHNTAGDMAMMWVADCFGCPADFNCSGTLTVQDIFEFLASYFGGEFRADFNGSQSITVQDVFDFLAAYFTGCD